jgi:hypothetical protein
VSVQVTPLAFPPAQYQQVYFSEIIRALNFYFRQSNNPGPAVVATLQILNLPTSPTGLPVGSVWRDSTDNTLKVVPDLTSNVVALEGVGTATAISNIGV